MDYLKNVRFVTSVLFLLIFWEYLTKIETFLSYVYDIHVGRKKEKKKKCPKIVKSKLCFVVPMYDIAIASKRHFGNFV